MVVNPDATAKNSGTDAAASVCACCAMLYFLPSRNVFASHPPSLGLYLSIPLSDQGDPNDPTLRLSDQANCDRTVANLAVYAIDNEDDVSAEAAANCIGELIQDTVSGATLCSCKFLVPHFSAFAVVDTSPSDDGPAPDGGAPDGGAPNGGASDVSSASGAALSAVVLAASALLLL